MKHDSIRTRGRRRNVAGKREWHGTNVVDLDDAQYNTDSNETEAEDEHD